MELADKINGCIAIEEAAASTYKTFIQLFPNEKIFWEGLLSDEIEHASFLKESSSFDVFSRLPLKAQMPSKSFIEKTLEFAESLKKRLMNPTSFQEALDIALKFEESKVETYTNELIAAFKASDDKSYLMNIDKILNDEKGHLSKIKNMMLDKGFLRFS